MTLMEILLEAPEVSLEEMLLARDNRAARQRSMIVDNHSPVVSVTLNIPGSRKAHSLAGKAFAIARAAMLVRLEKAGMRIVQSIESREKTGFEGIYAVEGDAGAMKALAVSIEETHPIGRLFDIDVLTRDGTALRGVDAGRSERKCLLCGGPVWECARARTHSAEQLSLRAAGLIREHLEAGFADQVAFLATKALLYEVAVSPKPGLVDRLNNGAHSDMDMFTFIGGATALTPYFRDMARRGLVFEGGLETMLPAFRLRGIWAEERMFGATGGVNTHRGLVFSMGIACAAVGYLWGSGDTLSLEGILDACAAIVAQTPMELDAPPSAADTHGRRAHARFGLTGVRGEASAGYPNIRHYGFPALRRAFAEGNSPNDAGVAALLHLIATVQDTNIVSRSDAATLADIRAEIGAFLDTAPDMPAMLRFAGSLDDRFIRENISPGGSADLLALTYFLHFVLVEGMEFVNMA